jgi:hypothetical protein
MIKLGVNTYSKDPTFMLCFHWRAFSVVTLSYCQDPRLQMIKLPYVFTGKNFNYLKISGNKLVRVKTTF